MRVLKVRGLDSGGTRMLVAICFVFTLCLCYFVFYIFIWIMQHFLGWGSLALVAMEIAEPGVGCP